jgi:hypothetical protein
MHYLVHYKYNSRHIARVLEERDEKEKYQNVRQEHKHTAHAADSPVKYHIFQNSVAQDQIYSAGKNFHAQFDECHGIAA